jgi:hypothetical protein
MEQDKEQANNSGYYQPISRRGKTCLIRYENARDEDQYYWKHRHCSPSGRWCDVLFTRHFLVQIGSVG